MKTLFISFFLWCALDCGAQVISSSGSSETVIASAATRIANGLHFSPDGSLGIITNGGGGWNFYADAGYFPSGVFSTATALTSGTMDNIYVTLIKTNLVISNPVDAFNYQAFGSVFHDSTNGYWIAFYHAEKWPNGDGSKFYGEIGIALSTNGTDFRDLGVILTPGVPYTTVSPAVHEIDGGANIVIGNWLYVYYQQATNSTPTVGVARCDWSTFVRSVESSTLPVFHKWKSDGTWTDPGVLGLGSPLAITLVSGEYPVWYDVKYYPPAAIYCMVMSVSLSENNNLRIIYSYDGISWFGEDTINASGQIVYPTLFSPDAPVDQLGVTNYIFGTETSDFTTIWDNATVSRWNLNINFPRSLTATTGNVGTINKVN